jgi:membrane-bound ClpP family serine protease
VSARAALALLAAFPGAAASAGGDGDSALQLAIAAILVIAAVALLTLEFVIATGGALAIAASATGLAAIILAFMASTTTGVVVLVLTPLIGALVVHWGLRRLVRTRAVPRAEITDDAGYHHQADRLGVAVGSDGELVTDAMPTGRARFATRQGAIELDVRVQGPVLSRGQRVVVTALHGASVSVSAAPPPAT